jgi:hypothetical protein
LLSTPFSPFSSSALRLFRAAARHAIDYADFASPILPFRYCCRQPFLRRHYFRRYAFSIFSFSMPLSFRCRRCRLPTRLFRRRRDDAAGCARRRHAMPPRRLRQRRTFCRYSAQAPRRREFPR